MLAEYPGSGPANSPQKEYGYRNGQLLVTAEPSSTFNGYLNRRAITIDHTKVPNTDQSNFPVLIKGTYSYLATVANGGLVQNANGYDVIFTSDSGCATKLNHETESYGATTGSVNYWVKVPTVSHTSDTVIYMCYGNSSITTDQTNKTGVWDSNYKGVWHFGDGTTLSTADSTNQLNGTNHGATAGAGKVAGAAVVAGAQNIGIGTSSLTSGITLEGWLYRTGNTNSFDIWADFGWNSTDGFVALAGGPNGMKHGVVKHAVLYIDSNVSSVANVWEHVVWTIDTDKKPRLFINGSLTFTSTDTQALVASTHAGSLGSRLDASGNPSQFFSGSLDEVRLSSVVRSADWIKTEYNNQNSPATFYTISSATTGSPASLHWLVTDQLGTPRMIVDQTGSLAGIKRHDYLPFGEEVFAGTGGRTTTQGYSSSDGVRQQFTQKERDTETGLDYFLARYYSSTQGRFTSSDPFKGSAKLQNPQSWNRYSYVLNRPLSLIDPNGMDDCTPQKPCIATTQADAEALTSANLNRALIKETVTVNDQTVAPLTTSTTDSGATLTMRPMLQVPTGPPTPTPDTSGDGHVMPGWLNNLLPSFLGGTAGYGGAAAAAGNGFALNSSVTVGSFRTMPGSYSFWNRGGFAWDKPWAAGIPAFAGVGVGIGGVLSNAQSPGEMNGDAQAWMLGLGAMNLELDLGTGSFHRPIWTLSITGGPGKGFGLMTMPVRSTSWEHWMDPVNPWADW